MAFAGFLRRWGAHLSANRGPTLLFSGLLVVQLVLGSWLLYQCVQHEAELRQWGQGYWLGLYVLSALCMAAALLPSSFVAGLGGYLFGWPSLLPLVTAYLAAALLGYVAARFADGGGVARYAARYPRAQRMIGHLHRHGFWLTALLRLLPVGAPFALTNVLLATAGIGWPQFVLGSAVGMLPRTVLALWLGTQARHLGELTANRPENAYVLVLVLLLAAVWGFFKWKISPSKHEKNK